MNSCWILIASEPRACSTVQHIRSQVMGDKSSVQCPEVDGQTVTLGEKSFQLNCRKNFAAQRRKAASGMEPFNESL